MLVIFFIYLTNIYTAWTYIYRIKISFNVHKIVLLFRLLDLKNEDCSKFYNMIDDSGLQNQLDNLKIAEESCLDKLETKNVDFGYNNESGHRQLLDAVNEAIEGFEQIKKHSNLDVNKFKEYENSQVNLNDIQKDRFDFENLKSEFDIKFPKFSEKLLKEVSEKVALIMDNDDE